MAVFPSEDAAPDAVQERSDCLGRFERVWLICCALVIGVSVVLRVWKLTNIPGLNGDEAEYGSNCLALLHHQPISWRTNDGNLRNPLYYLPLLLLQSVCPPSIVVLRITAVLYGVAALWINFRLCRRTFGRQAAVATTLLLAALPEDIVQSRLGWDPSQSVLFDCLVVYFAVMVAAEPDRSVRSAWLAVIALIAAVIAHPSNAFLAIFLAVAVAVRWSAQVRRWFDPRTPGQQWLINAMAAACVLLAALVWKWNWIVSGLQMTLHTNSAEVFPIFYLHFLSGVTVFRYVAGSLEPGPMAEWVVWLYTVAAGVLFLPVLWQTVRALWPRSCMAPADRVVFAGWLATFAAFLAIGGAEALLPGNERFGLALIVPAVLAVVRAAQIGAAGRRTALRALGVVAVCIGAAMLVCVWFDLFAFIERTGGLSEETFRTGPVEPKLQAWRTISSEMPSGTGRIGIVVTSTWWNYQPLRYFAWDDPNVVVIATQQTKNSAVQAQIDTAAQDGELWFVEFAGSAKIANIKQQLNTLKTPYHEQYVFGYADTPILDIVHVTAGRPPQVL